MMMQSYRSAALHLLHMSHAYTRAQYKDNKNFLSEVINFAVAAQSQQIVNILFYMIDDKLTFLQKEMVIVALFNGIYVLQTKHYIKISAEKCINKIMP